VLEERIYSQVVEKFPSEELEGSLSYRITGVLDFFHRPVFLGVETRTTDDGKV
jgi:hypothetical protein